MFRQLAGPEDPDVQPGGPGNSGLWVGLGLTGAWVGPGLGVQVARTGPGMGPDRLERGFWRLERPGVGEGAAEWVGRGVVVPRSWVTLGCGLVTAADRCDLS